MFSRGEKTVLYLVRFFSSVEQKTQQNYKEKLLVQRNTKILAETLYSGVSPKRTVMAEKFANDKDVRARVVFFSALAADVRNFQPLKYCLNVSLKYLARALLKNLEEALSRSLSSQMGEKDSAKKKLFPV